MLPTLFISHGSPATLIDATPGHHFLAGHGQTFPRPKAILVASAHWETARPAVNAVARNATIYDFYGFPDALYEMTYPAPGSLELAARVADLLGAGGLETGIDRQRGLDHGAWVPLKLMYPGADIPVVQISLQTRLGPEHHLRLGRLLSSLRGEGVLVMGSGSFTHNLGAIERGDPDAVAPAWVMAFTEWMRDAITGGRTADLLAYRERAPFARENHPTGEHLLPLFVALGAAGESAKARHLHHSVMLAVVGMDAFAFG